MKKVLTLTVFSLLAFSVFASFPVHKENAKKAIEKTEITIGVTPTSELAITEEIGMSNFDIAPENAISPASAASDSDQLIILLLLWFFLGALAAHRWYAGKPAGWNILFILTLGGLGIWALVDLINILTGEFME